MRNIIILSVAILLVSCKATPKKRPPPPDLPWAKGSLRLSERLAQPEPGPTAAPLPGFRLNPPQLFEGQLYLSWQEPPPFPHTNLPAPTMLQVRSNVASAWKNAANATIELNQAIPAAGPMALFRVQGAFPLALLDSNSQPRVTWSAPDMPSPDYIAKWYCFRRDQVNPPTSAEWMAGTTTQLPTLDKILTLASSGVVPSPGADVTLTVNEDISWVRFAGELTPTDRGDYLNLETKGQFRVISKNNGAKTLTLRYIPLADAPNNQHATETAGAGLRLTQASLRDNTVPVNKLWYYELGATSLDHGVPQNAVGYSQTSPATFRWKRLASEAVLNSRGFSFRGGIAGTPGLPGSVAVNGNRVATIGYEISTASHASIRTFALDGTSQLVFAMNGIPLGSSPQLAPCEPRAVTIDSTGHIYCLVEWQQTVIVKGTKYQTDATMKKTAVLKIFPAGEEDWAFVLIHPTAQDNGANSYGIAINSANQVFICGSCGNGTDFGGGPRTFTGNGIAAFVAKYDANGTHLWDKVFSFNATNGAFASFHQVQVDPSSGDVVLTGRAFGKTDFGGGAVNAVEDDTIVLVRLLSSNGAHVWSKSFGNCGTSQFGPTQQAFRVGGRSLAVAANGDIVWSGLFTKQINLGGSTFDAGNNILNGDAFFARFTSAGTHLWSKHIFGASQDNETTAGAAVDGAGNMVFCGATIGATDFGGGLRPTTTYTSAFVAKYTSAGSWVWDKVFPSQQSATGVAVDADRNVYVSGHSFNQIDLGDGQPFTSSWVVSYTP